MMSAEMIRVFRELLLFLDTLVLPGDGRVVVDH